MRTENETRLNATDVEARLVEDTLELTARQPRQCREVVLVPQVADKKTKRELSDSGETTQLWLGIGALAAGVAGVASLAAPCTKTETDSNGTEMERECTSDEAKVRTGVGVVFLGGGLGLGGAFIGNIARTGNVMETVDVPPRRYPRSWRACGDEPLAETEMKLVLADDTALTAQLDESGRATIDLSDVQPTRALVENPSALLYSGGEHISTLDLTDTELYAEWKQFVEQAVAEARARLAEERAEAERLARERTIEHERQRAESIIDTAEEVLAQAKAPWTVKSWLLFSFAVQLRKELNELSLPSGGEQRVQTIDRTLARRRHGWKKARAKIAQQMRQHVLALGREAVVRRLKAPSTATMVGEDIGVTCGNGFFLTAHTVDAQNSFGAMIRDTSCAAVNLFQGKAMIEKCGGLVEPDLTCDLLPWLWERGRAVRDLMDSLPGR